MGGEEREACPICKVVFSKKQKLKYHMRIHTGEGLETCHICNKIFTHSYALNIHMRTHSKENNFMCHECKKIFQNGTKLYKCEVWGDEFEALYEKYEKEGRVRK